MDWLAPTLLVVGDAAQEIGNDVALVSDLGTDGAADVLYTDGNDSVWLLDSSGAAATLRRNTGATVTSASVASAGDLDGDGLGDAASAGADRTDPYGWIDIWWGGEGGAGSTTVHGDSATFLARDLAAAGDVDGDGYADLVASARGGQVRPYLGGASRELTQGTDAESNDPSGVDGAGDVDGDGYADVVLGDIGSDAGAVLLARGGPGGFEAEPVTIEVGDDAGAYLGLDVAALGDVNGDGWGDLAAGASRGETDAGVVHVYLGGAGGFVPAARLSGRWAGGRLGWSVSGAGDVDGDGYADLVAGAPLAEATRGAVVLWRGGAHGFQEACTIVGSGPLDALGTAIDGGHDIDGDGLSDLVLGAAGAGGRPGELWLATGASDRDGDGVTSLTDCDDTDPTAYPGAPEVPGDGVDQDCDGVDDLPPDDTGDTAPADTDGADTAAPDTAGADSDPTDPADRPRADGGCSCATGPAPAGSLGLLLVLLAALRRARVRSSTRVAPYVRALDCDDAEARATPVASETPYDVHLRPQPGGRPSPGPHLPGGRVNR